MSAVLICANYRNLVIARSRHADLAHLIFCFMPIIHRSWSRVIGLRRKRRGEGVVCLMEENGGIGVILFREDISVSLFLDEVDFSSLLLSIRNLLEYYSKFFRDARYR